AAGNMWHYFLFLSTLAVQYQIYSFLKKIYLSTRVSLLCLLSFHCFPNADKVLVNPQITGDPVLINMIATLGMFWVDRKECFGRGKKGGTAVDLGIYLYAC
ncbi:hypothetical protein ACJX0J_035399, partial [Zea mays]